MKRYVHIVGLVAGAILTTLPMLGDLLPGTVLKTVSAVAGFVVALFTNLDRVMNIPPAAMTLLCLLPATSVLVGAGCKSGGGIPGPVVAVGECTSAAVAPQVQEIIADVSSALATGDYVAMLTAIVAKVGMDVVNCAIQEVLHSVGAQRAVAPDDQLLVTMQAHGNAWISVHGR